jgi:hypothetical protein
MNIYIFIYFVFSILLLDRSVNATVPYSKLLGYYLILIFMCLRYGYGNDFFNYLDLYNYYQGLASIDYSFEFIYKWLNSILPSYQLLIVFHSVILLLAFISLINALKIYGCNPSIAGALFFLNPYLFLIHLTAIRQSLAVAIFIIFICLYMNYKRWFLLLLSIILPPLFHKAALVYLIVPLLLLFRDKIYYLRWFNKIALTLGGVIILKLIIGGLVIGVFAKYAYYYENGISSDLSLTTLLYVLLLGFAIVFAKPNNKFYLGNHELFNYKIVYLFSYLTFCFSLFSLFLPMFSRVTLFFDMFIPFLLASSTFKVNRYLVCGCFIVVYLIRNVSFLKTKIWYEGFNSYEVFFL